jgi:hypothetical protein
MLISIYQLPKDKVEYERSEEQRLIDKLIRDAEREEENRKIQEIRVKLPLTSGASCGIHT